MSFLDLCGAPPSGPELIDLSSIVSEKTKIVSTLGGAGILKWTGLNGPSGSNMVVGKKVAR